MESGIKNSLVLQSDEAVVLTAQEEFVDTLPNGRFSSIDRTLYMNYELCDLHIHVRTTMPVAMTTVT